MDTTSYLVLGMCEIKTETKGKEKSHGGVRDAAAQGEIIRADTQKKERFIHAVKLSTVSVRGPTLSREALLCVFSSTYGTFARAGLLTTRVRYLFFHGEV